jgi:hypothetical protein
MELDELEKAAKRHERRRKRFVEEGLSEDEAWDLAEKLFDRDRDTGDDRRLCFECSNYVDASKVCLKMRDRAGKPQMPIRFILQRCPTFQLREVKK